jgi:hypothetical protein
MKESIKKNQYYVGDIFELNLKDYNQKKFVILVRSIITKEHFYLISLTSFEPWSERVVTINDRFERAWVTLDEVKYLAETNDVRYIGNISEFKDKLVSLFDALKVA